MEIQKKYSLYFLDKVKIWTCIAENTIIKISNFHFVPVLHTGFNFTICFLHLCVPARFPWEIRFAVTTLVRLFSCALRYALVLHLYYLRASSFRQQTCGWSSQMTAHFCYSNNNLHVSLRSEAFPVICCQTTPMVFPFIPIGNILSLTRT